MERRWLVGIFAIAGAVGWVRVGSELGRNRPEGGLTKPRLFGPTASGLVPPATRPDARGASCGDGTCDLAAGECDASCPDDCADVPCDQPCDLDGRCDAEEGAACPDCYAPGCNFDGRCTVGENPRCPDCSCGDGFCDSGGGECEETCPGDCPGTVCVRACDFDGICGPDEAASCPDCSCGNRVCEPAIEDCEICPLDCGACADGCGDGICAPGEGPDCEDCVPGGGG